MSEMMFYIENSWCEIGVPAVPAEGKILGGYIKNSWSFVPAEG